jgi:hypothetical protein
MRVWRIECPVDRKGPWRSDRASDFSFERASDGHYPGDGPRPCEDVGRSIQGDEVCACKSLEQLGRWFHDEHYAALATRGFVLAEYEAEPTAEGDWQVLVPRDLIRHVADHALPGGPRR